MLDLSPTKLIIIFVVVVVLLGPKRLPQVARQLGAGWRKLVGFQQQIERELRESMPDLPSSQEIARFARSPVSILNHLADFPAAPEDALVEDPSAPAPGAPAPGAAAPGAAAPGAPDQSGAPDADGVGAHGASGDEHWPEDRSSARPPAPAPRAGRPVRPARSGRQTELLADLAHLADLAADDPTMN